MTEVSGPFTEAKYHYFEFTPIEPDGSDWHPDVEQHKKMADEMPPYLKTIMNW